MVNNHRTTQRYNFSLPVNLSFGTQITLQGQIRNLSLKSAFINVKSSVHMALNDELTFHIGNSADNPEDHIQGSARISRLAVGEGIAIYFTAMDETSSSRLQELISSIR